MLEDVAAGRRNAGLSLRSIGRAIGVSKSTVDRMESRTGTVIDLSILASMAASVGLDVRLRAFPAGDAIRDAGQQRLLGRLRVRLPVSLGWSTEVPLPIEGDLRAWDAMIEAEVWRLAVDAETVLDDVQAVERRVQLKMRDGGVDHVLLLVADTRRNRRALAAAPTAFAGFSRDARATLRALADGRDPGTSAIVML